MSKIQVEIYRQGMACQSQYRNTQLKLVPLLPTNVVQAKAEEYFPESTRDTTNNWPYYRYRETAGKLDLVIAWALTFSSDQQVYLIVTKLSAEVMIQISDIGIKDKRRWIKDVVINEASIFDKVSILKRIWRK